MPLPPNGTGSCYARLEYRRQMEIAVVGVTAVCARRRRVAGARVAITALAPTILRVPEAEARSTGSDGGADAIQAAARRGRRGPEPITDVRGSADYRRAMADVLGAPVVKVAPARDGGEAFPVPASPAFSTWGLT